MKFPTKSKFHARVRELSAASLFLSALMAAPAAHALPGLANPAISRHLLQRTDLLIAQDDGADEEKDVPQSQIDKYVAVYKAMQKNHGLTAEQAALQQGMTISQFRELENRIEGNDLVREQVRKLLRNNAGTDAK